jgi:hypothetical protein
VPRQRFEIDDDVGQFRQRASFYCCSHSAICSRVQ